MFDASKIFRFKRKVLQGILADLLDIPAQVSHMYWIKTYKLFVSVWIHFEVTLILDFAVTINFY